MKNKSLIIKILFFYLLILAVFFAFIFIFFFENLKNDSVKSVLKNLKNYTILIEDEANQFIVNNEIDKFQSYAETKAKILQIRITYVDVDGKVLVDTSEKPQYMENHEARPEIKKAIEGINDFDIRQSNTLKKNMLYYGYGIKINGIVKGVLRTSIYIDDIDKMVDSLKVNYLLIILFLVVISILSILLIYFNLKNDIKIFSEISDKVTNGNLEIRFPDTNSYEVNELSSSFKKMIVRIKELFTDLTNEKNEIESIISSVKEGIAVIDKNGIIKRANDGLKNYFQNTKVEGKYYWEIIRNNDLKEIVKNINLDNALTEFEFNDKNYLISINNIPDKEETVLIIYDVTELKKLEKIKKDFVTNAGHELGTPLTAIKGFVETLLDEEKDGNKIKYLNIILRHADRLSNIVKDLTMLSKLEDENQNIKLEQIDLIDVLNDVLPLFNDKLKEKGISIKINTTDKDYLINGDFNKLEQLFINLLDNAIKYTDEGTITVILSRENGKVKASIIDEGIGIPENDKTRIFERFYVVDKSRSKQNGGTGLGLSIVKHIINLHNAEITIENNYPKGSKFIIKF